MMVGGQALTEGVLVRTPERWALAVRRPDGSIHTESHEIVERFARLQRSALRGLVALADSISIGWRAIGIAARISTGIEVGADQLGAVFIPILVGAMLVFIAAPGVLSAGRSGIVADVVEASGRALTLVIYLATVSRTSPARRMFAYHGAEHKTIAAFERLGRAPSIEEARAESAIHVRCGTDFLALFVITCGVVYAFVPRRPLLVGAALRVTLVPFVAAVAYELMRSVARRERTLVSRLLTWPGRTLQRITTREPTDDLLEVASAALRLAVEPRPHPWDG